MQSFFYFILHFFWKEKYKFLAVAVVVFAIGYFKFFCTKKHDWNEPTKVVETEIVKKSSLKQQINLIGTVRPKHYCILTAKAGGTIDILIPAGAVLKKGEMIAKIENPDIEKTYNLSLSAREIAQNQHSRTLQLVSRGVNAKKDSEDSLQKLIEAEKNLARASIDHENTLVKAPFNGILGAYKIKDGEQVCEGNQVATFYNREQLMIEFEIPNQYIQKINPGQEVLVNGKALALKHVQKAIDEESHMCPASVEFETSGDDLIIGSSVDLMLTVEEKQNAIVITNSAVFLRDGQNVVYIVKDGKTEIRKIELGIKNREKAEAIKGLEEKDELIIIGQDRLYPGMIVKIAEKNVDGNAEKNAEKNAGAEKTK
jgi:membrane fusion protein (multidrug efflux system)